MPNGIDYLINMAGGLVGTLLRTCFLMLYPQLKLLGFSKCSLWREVISFAHSYCEYGGAEYSATDFLSCFTVSGRSPHSLHLVLCRCYGR